MRIKKYIKTSATRVFLCLPGWAWVRLNDSESSGRVRYFGAQGDKTKFQKGCFNSYNEQCKVYVARNKTQRTNSKYIHR